MAQRTDEELVLAARGGGADSFMTLCHRYYSPLVAIACAVLRDRHLAEDAAQEALAKACRRLDSLKEPCRVGSWLATICRHEAADIARKTPRLASLGDHDVPMPSPRPDAMVDAVREAIDQLPNEVRELLYLRYRNELSYEEISVLLAISPQAVNGRLRRARQAVKAYLERREKEDRHEARTR